MGGADTPTPEDVGNIDVDEVGLTATALAELFSGQGGGEATPTRENLGNGQGGASTAVPVIGGGTSGELPDTGLFDDVGGTDSMALLALVAVGLVGVIFGARRLRTVSNRE